MKKRIINLSTSSKMFYKSRILRLALYLALFIGIGSCQRRLLEDEVYFSALIPVKVYWDVAGITAHNASILFYRPDGSLYLEKSFAGADDTYAETAVELEVGEYTVVVFNEIRNQIDHVRMRGHEQLSTFEAYVTPASTVFNTSSRTTGETMVNQPGHLAAWKGEFTVTPDMVTRSRSRSSEHIADVENSALDTSINALTNIHPLRKTAVANMSAHIVGINYARMPALVELRNMAEGYHFSSDLNSQVPVTVQFRMNNRQYLPGSYVEGTISESVVTFGLAGNRTDVQDIPLPIHLDFNFKLVDVAQTLEFRSFNVTDLVRVAVDGNQQVALNIHVVFPTPLPEVKPEGGTGMDAETVEWEGEIIGVELGK